MEQTITRAEHLAWCKERALEYANAGDLTSSMASMLSDLRKHTETENHPGEKLWVMMVLGGLLNTKEEVIKFINGFN